MEGFKKKITEEKTTSAIKICWSGAAGADPTYQGLAGGGWKCLSPVIPAHPKALPHLSAGLDGHREAGGVGIKERTEGI